MSEAQARAGEPDAGTYEVLRARLAERAAELTRRAEALNERRLEVFGTAGLRLLTTARVTTDRAADPVDVAALGDLLLVGHHPSAGDAAEVADVLTGYRLRRDGDAAALAPEPDPEPLRDTAFRQDFAELLRYFRGARLLRLQHTEDRLLAAFRTGAAATDRRVLRWSAPPGGATRYLDNRGERDLADAPAPDITWTGTTRDDHRTGRHPHVSVDGDLFVSTTGGHLTVKLEDDTETPAGIHREPVDEPLQSLADAEVHHARVGELVLLRVRPYKETAWRHLVFTTRTRTVQRLDGIGLACRALPAGQGIVHPGGYHLADGRTKSFPDLPGSAPGFDTVVRSPNGEDVLYAFRDPAAARCRLVAYNLIRQEAAAPVDCRGWALHEDGTLVVLHDAAEPGRVHAVQLWQTPFASDTHAAAHPPGTGPLARIGNPDLVRGIADCLAAARDAAAVAPTAPAHRALAAATRRAADRHHWLGDPEAGGLLEPLRELAETAEQVLDEYESVRELTSRAEQAVDEAAAHTAALVRRARGETPRTADALVAQLAELRAAQGRLAGLHDLRRADHERISALEEELAGDLDAAAHRAADVLATEQAFTGYQEQTAALADEAAALATAAAAEPLAARLDEQTAALRAVSDVVAGLDAADATVRTGILARIGDVLAAANRARSVLRTRRRELLHDEGRAEYAADSALLAQATTAALDAAATPADCDEQLARLLLRIEDLQARFADHDDVLTELATRRADVADAFAARKQALLDEHERRADRLAQAAARLLDGVRRRAATRPGRDELHTFFASDPLVTRLRQTAADLRDLGDPVRAEEVESGLHAARREAARALRDRLDLDGADGTLRLGRHRFTVNTQPLDLTIVPHGGRPAYTVTGTDYRVPVDAGALAGTERFWDRPVVSESPELYRGEYLAAALLDRPDLSDAADADHDTLLTLVREAADRAHDEGYERGVHDHDAALLLGTALRLRAGAGTLCHPPHVRAAAQLLWTFGTGEADRTAWSVRARSLARARTTFTAAPGGAEDDAAGRQLRRELAAAAEAFLTAAHLPGGADGAPLGARPDEIGAYLADELAARPDGFAASAGARTLRQRFRDALGGPGGVARKEFEADLDALGDDLAARWGLAEAWLRRHLAATGPDHADRAAGAGAGAAEAADPPHDLDLPEAVALELCGDALPRYDADAPRAAAVDGLLGDHPRLTGGSLTVRIDELPQRARRFRAEEVPAHRAYRRRRAALVEEAEQRLRIADHRPRAISGFVRNRLIDRAYLPLIGDNLAKQLGTAGDTGQGDSSGLLLLISPPGYGKTTLMEYLAERLGMLLVRIDGPALGQHTVSLDPAEAPNAAARREVEKISFALEAGSNTLLYLDDIQHTSPELLQAFIPLCDAQRRITGVRDGRARTHDLRGKRFAVVMAGNPYTEAGRRFRVPDMLANRADAWNLGDVLSGRGELFALSHVENALSANPHLAPLADGDPADLDVLLAMAAGSPDARADRLTRPLPPDELHRTTAVLRHLVHVRDTVLAVNRAYLASAAQQDAARTEPPFRLQGSYRNTARLAERIVPVMTDDEREALIDDHYAGEAQTLTDGAEANLLKLAELRGRLTAAQRDRWTAVKEAYAREQALGGSGDDPVGRAVGAIGLLAERVAGIEAALAPRGGPPPGRPG